jgi:hypothetical protein
MPRRSGSTSIKQHVGDVSLACSTAVATLKETPTPPSDDCFSGVVAWAHNSSPLFVAKGQVTW